MNVSVALGYAATIPAGLLAAHALVNSRLLRRPPPDPSTVEHPVSVLVPVRDEAHRVRPCLESVLAQRDVPAMEVVVLDDGSTDGSAHLVRSVAAGDPRLRLITGRPLPPGWLGKPYACEQLAAHADPASPVLVFVDADVVLAPTAIAAAVALLDGFDLASPYPLVLAVGVGERLVQPLLQWSWLTFLPLRAMERSRRTSLAAAGGQFLAVRRAGYLEAGGHAAVRGEVLEDIALARAVKRAGGRIALADGSRLASCRMYRSWSEVVAGYTKSLWAAFGSPVGAVSVVFGLWFLYVAPPVLAVVSAALGRWPATAAGGAAYLLGVLGRVASARATGTRSWPDALAHPASIVLFGWLVVRSYRQHRRGRLVWKGRSIDPTEDGGRA